MLTHEQARRFYDRFGQWQETQRFYEEEAIGQLIAHGGFGVAERVIELGCGTGQLAEQLLERHLPPQASLLALDISPSMVRRIRQRLERFGERAEVRLTDGRMETGQADSSCDRFVSTYLLDLLSREDIAAFLREAHRVLAPAGRLAVAGLTPGFTIWSRIISAAWRTAHRLNPLWVGGCRPLEMLHLLPEEDWEVLHQGRCCPYGISSETVICRPKK